MICAAAGMPTGTYPLARASKFVDEETGNRSVPPGRRDAGTGLT